jgi:hypothetical protein
MGGIKDDASTDIESLVTKFAIEMSKCATDLLKKSPAKDGKSDPKSKPVTIKFSLGTSKNSKSRTPAEQAADVAAGTSWACWGAHMADKARDMIMKVDGKVSWDPKKVFGQDFAEFKKEWAATMKKYGLKNYKGQDGWGDGDEFHLELPDAKIAKTDERAKACVEEYIRLTREAGKKKNTKFEDTYKALLKPYIDAADAKAKSTSG